MEEAEHYRCRRIYLKHSDDPGRKADAACDALANVDGILLAAPHSEFSVHIIYALNKVSFEIVIGLLDELQFEMDKSILLSLRNTIYCYLEDNARENIHVDVTEFQEDEPESPDIPHEDEEKYWEDYH